MFYVDNPTGVPVMPEPSPVSSLTDLFFTEGGNGVPPTYPGPDWFNIIQSELINIVRAAGLDPDKMDNTQILAALKKLFLQRQNPFGDIKSDGAVATALANLGLGDVAHLSDWTSGGDEIAGWRICPDGFIEQWGQSGSATGGRLTIPFPISFPLKCLTIQLTEMTAASVSPGSAVQSWGLNYDTVSNTAFSVVNGSPSSIENVRWRALGK